MFTEVVVKAHCEKHGEYESKVMQVGAQKLQTGCPHCEAEREAEKKAQEAVERKARKLEKLKNLIGIPKRYETATIENFVVSNEKQAKAKRYCEAYVERFESCLDKGTSLVFCGNVGTGKTHLAYAVARAVFEKYQTKLLPELSIENMDEERPETVSKVVSALDILREVKATYSKANHETEMDVIARYVLLPLLVIDEVGVQFGSEAEKVIMFDILNRRYLDMKPTIMISNLPITELTNFVGDRVVDRMRENNGAVIEFDWESNRK
jgi:DNA replication protein DnaC